MKIYLDSAATTQVDPAVIEQMVDVLKNDFGNPSSIHGEGRKAKNRIEQARKVVAGHIGASTSEIVFTSGGTEANNMALKCAVRDMGVQRIISTPIEHHCVTHTLERLEKQGAEIQLLSVAHCGSIDLQELEQALASSEKKTLVSIMFANNEIGTVYPVQEIAELAQKYNALFHSDTVQAVGHFPIDVSTWPVHFMSGAAHKFHGPKGIGFLYMNAETSIDPMIDGGSQERKMRAGTENITGIVGLAAALDLACTELDDRKKHILSLRTAMKEKLLARFEGIEINGTPDEKCLYTVLSVSFPPSETSSFLLMQLDMKGICASAGSACSSGTSQPSHVIQSVRSKDNYTTIRFSFSHFNTHDEIEFAIEQLSSLLPQHATT